jgi:(E)-4-hydroxy-3-methylbut-2-enyl-diphosphate synthase
LIFRRTYNGIDLDEMLTRSSVDYALLLNQKKSAGIFIENNNCTSDEEIVSLCLDVLQGLGLRYSKAEFVACPSCGRTKFNLFESFDKVKAKTSQLKELQIAVMGCIVNGPGEMGDADYGYVGAGPGKVTLYKSGEMVLKNIEEDIAVDSLIDLIKEGGDWVEVN